MIAGVVLERRISRERVLLGFAPTPPGWSRLRPVLLGIASAGFALSLCYAELTLGCLDTTEVQPPEWSRQVRVCYHAALASLLLLATAIDLDCYLIPDAITGPGILCGVVAAVAFGDLQFAHLWVDWTDPNVRLYGPYIPQWYKDYPMAHALAWSVAGCLAGGGLTLLVRILSSRVLGVETMGLGDVTLMAMVGSFLGWQAVVLAFALAPFTGLIVGLIGKLLFNRPYLPYGPCLSAASMAVIFGWGWLWFRTRLMFSDLVGLAMLAGIGAVVMTLLLALLRLYRNIPTGR
jgi:leader peptidase (prepilin peptidase)/N-methyltransferase